MAKNTATNQSTLCTGFLLINTITALKTAKALKKKNNICVVLIFFELVINRECSAVANNY